MHVYRRIRTSVAEPKEETRIRSGLDRIACRAEIVNNQIGGLVVGIANIKIGNCPRRVITGGITADRPRAAIVYRLTVDN